MSMNDYVHEYHVHAPMVDVMREEEEQEDEDKDSYIIKDNSKFNNNKKKHI